MLVGKFGNLILLAELPLLKDCGELRKKLVDLIKISVLMVKRLNSLLKL